MNEIIELKPLQQGASSYPTFKLKDENGIAILLSTLENIRVLFVNDSNGCVLSKFSMVAETGFDNTNFVQINTTTFGIRLQSETTLLWNIGIVRIEIDVKTAVTGFTPEFKNILTERVYNILPSKISKL